MKTAHSFSCGKHNCKGECLPEIGPEQNSAGVAGYVSPCAKCDCKWCDVSYADLVETIMDLVSQACTLPEGKQHHSFIAAYEGAFFTLQKIGVMKSLGYEKYKLDWKAFQDNYT
jgi:hypothetical protein